MPQATMYQPLPPTFSASGFKLPIRADPSKNAATTSLSTATPFARPANAPLPPQSAPGTSSVPSLTSGSTSGASETDDMKAIDVMKMMRDRVETIGDPIPMDRTIAKQAQTSGELNAKQHELAELQALMQRRMKSMKPKLDEGIKAAKEAQKGLEWASKNMSKLNTKVSQKHAAAYAAASSKVLPRAF